MAQLSHSIKAENIILGSTGWLPFGHKGFGPEGPQVHAAGCGHLGKLQSFRDITVAELLADDPDCTFYVAPVRIRKLRASGG